MFRKYQRLTPAPFLASCVAILLGATTLAAESVTGTIEAEDAEAHTWTLQTGEDQTRSVKVHRGDIAVYDVGDQVRGEVFEEEGTLHLEKVWPHDINEAGTMARLNGILRRDTLKRGRQVFRERGEDMPEFALYNQFGELIQPRDLHGQVVVLNFIFTRCMNPRMCPAATERMKVLLNRVQEANLGKDVQLVSITLDAVYDTPGIFHAYASDRDIDGEDFWFLGGPEQPIEDLKRQLGIIGVPDEQNIINHTMRTLLINQHGRITYYVPGSMWSVDDFFSRIQKLVEPSEDKQDQGA